MRLVFLGTPTFAVPTLEHIAAAGHNVLAVVTQPDRPRGRGQHPAASPVKQCAERLGAPVYQPERIRRPEALEYLRALNAEAMVVVGYGQIIPQSVIDLAPFGIINVHASLLPKYRGAGPVQWATINGETCTGVTTMRIDAGLDTGDILLQAETDIGDDETAVELAGRLSTLGAALLVQTLDGLAAGSITPRRQDSTQATYAPLLKKEDGLIDWSYSAQSIHNRVRGLQPWPGAYTTFRNQTLNIWKTRVVGQAPRPARDPQVAQTPGHILTLRPLSIQTGDLPLELLEVQLEGRKRLSAADFANGQRLTDNEILGAPI